MQSQENRQNSVTNEESFLGIFYLIPEETPHLKTQTIACQYLLFDQNKFTIALEQGALICSIFCFSSFQNTTFHKEKHENHWPSGPGFSPWVTSSTASGSVAIKFPSASM